MITASLIILQFIKVYSTLELDVCQGRKSAFIIIPVLIHLFWPTSAAREFCAITLVDKASDLRKAIDVNILSQSLIFKFLREHI